jgi:hypothetical protein
MPTWLSCRVLGIVLALAAIVGWSAATSLAASSGPPLVVRDTEAPSGISKPPPSDTPSKPTGPETPTDKFTRQVAAIQEQLSTLQSEEISLNLNADRAIGAAAQGVEDLNAAAENLFRNKMFKGLPEYRQALLAAAVQWKQLMGKYEKVFAMGAALQRDRPKAPAEVQPAIDQILGRLQEKKRNLLEKLAGLCERAGDYRSAALYDAAILETVPADKRLAERKLREKIGDLFFKLEDYKDSLTYLMALFNDILKKDSQRNPDLGWKICDVLDKAHEYATEYAFLKALAEANPDQGRLKDRLRDLQKKVGATAGSVPAAGK